MKGLDSQGTFRVTRKALLAAALVAMGSGCATAANLPGLPSRVSALPPGVGAPIPDSVLAHVRGKGILSNGEVVAFGVTMSTRWQNAMNDAVSASLTVWMNDSGQVETGSRVSGTYSSAGPSGNSVTGAPPARMVATGVGQSVQVAGDGNSAHNQLAVNPQIVTNATPPTGLTHSGSFDPAPASCGTGCTTTMSANSNGLSLGVQTADGVAQQRIGAGALTQAIQLHADDTSVLNQLTIQPQIQQQMKSNAGVADVGLVLQSLAGVR